MSELQKTIEDLGRAFEAFKSSNDQRLAEIEKHGRAADDLSDKVERINSDVSELSSLKAQIENVEAAIERGQLGTGGAGGTESERAKADHEKAFNTWFRRGGEGIEASLPGLEVRAELSTQSDPDGGFIVPEEYDQEITRVLGTVSAMRNLARVVPVGSATFKKIVNQGGTTSGWVGETESRQETNTPTLSELEFPTMELYAEPHATQSMLDDAMLDVGAWLADEVSVEFAEEEGDAFITGNGVKKPRGILGYTAVANASYSWGNVGYIASGADGAFAASNPSDKLIDLVHALRSGYRAGASWVTNTDTIGSIRKFKDGNGDYIWRPGLQAGESSTLLGYEVHEDENMPAVASNSLSLAFGNWMRAYVITDRMGTRVLRDPYTSKPYVKFYTTKRVGGGVQNFEAYKVMKFASS